jgi:hypothetical protein
MSATGLRLAALVGGVALAGFYISCAPPDLTKVDNPALRAVGRDGPPFDSGFMSPFGSRAGRTYSIESPPPTETDVILSFIVTGDFSDVNEYINLDLNGRDLGRVLESGGGDCVKPAHEFTVRVPAEIYNEALIKHGRIDIGITPSDAVDAGQCAGGAVRVLVDYCGGGACPRANVVEGPPRLVSAISQSNTAVKVTFNEPVYEGAEDPANYTILQSEKETGSAALQVLSAKLSQDMTTVTLETGSQDQVTYVLVVTGIQDLAGNVLSPPSLLVDPTRTEFAGTPAINNGVDTDKDGLADAIEIRGWTINIRRTGGDVETRHVTSDPYLADTDGDGLSDLVEFQNRSDPRRADTDGDTVDDATEYNVYYSNLNDQDSDDDGIDDALETGFFKTSPILADTDGDGLSDGRELFELFRDPRIADLPRPRITVSQVRLHLDERFTYTDETGQTQSVENTTSSSLASSSSRSFGRSDTREWGSADEGFIKAGGKLGYDKGFKFELSAEGGYKWSTHDDNTVQTTAESSLETQRAFEQSLARGRELSQTSSVTRSIEGARIDAEVNIESAGDIAFTISNIEITVMQPNRLVLGGLLPVASLIASSELTTGNEAVFNLGPLVSSRGPVLFSNTEVFPQLVENLMREPSGLIFRIANYDVTDELGRNFAFASQEARDRCAGIVINRGDDEPERVLVALNAQVDTNEYVGGGNVGGWDENGRVVGVPMDYVLQDILGLKKNSRVPDGITAGLNFRADTVAAGDDIQLVPRGTIGLPPHTVIISAGANGVLDTTPAEDDRAEVVTGYETSPTCGPTTADRIFEPIGGNGIVDTIAAGDDIQVIPFGAPVSPGATIILPGPDGYTDTIPRGDDRAQFPGQIAVPSAIVENLDGDGVVETAAEGDDEQLIPVGTTGVAPLTPIIGPGLNGIIDTQPQGDEVYVSPDCGDGVADGPEVLVRFEGRRSGDFQRTWQVRFDRVLPTGGNFGDILVYPGDDISISFVQDVDNDGILAQAEFVYGSSDTERDSDGDGIDDYAEVAVGWTVAVQGQPLLKVFPSPALVDSDGDGLTDWEEQDLSRYITDPVLFSQIFGSAPNPDAPISSNPRLADTDGDGIDDKVELDGYIIGQAIRAGADGRAQSEALGDDVQKVFVGATAFDPGTPSGGVVILPGPNRVIDSRVVGDDVLDNGRLVRTSPVKPDHDGDTRPDGRERDLGGDPTNPNDSDDFRDTDGDGLSDAEESIVGWTVTVYPLSGPPIVRHVTSNKYVADTDLDGLPDLLERQIGSDPTRADTDGDGISDYDEFNRFEEFVGLQLRFPGFVLDGRNSARYGTNPNRVDTDGDTLDDRFEAEVGWRVFAFGDAQPRVVKSDPLFPDSDLDGLRDDMEFLLKTDPHDADTDGDERLDGDDIAFCRSTGAPCIPVSGSCSDCEGSNPLRPDLKVTVTYERVSLNSMSGSELPDATPGVHDWRFRFGLRIPSSELYDQTVNIFRDEDVADLPRYCNTLSLGSTIVARLNASPRRPTTISILPGDLLILDGLFHEVTVPGDCDDPVGPGSGYATFQQTYTFDQLRNGSTYFEADLQNGADTVLEFEASVVVLIEVR